MNGYLVYVAIAMITIASPGPGVILTIANSLKYGFSGAIPGILAVALGMFCVAIISATGLAIILSTSALVFVLLKYVGAAYLIYLGIKLWRSTSAFAGDKKQPARTGYQRFIEGLMVTLLNPKAIFFFMSLFPQFIEPTGDYASQFILLSLTFSCLVIIIHCLYGLTANLARARLASPKGSNAINKTSGSLFVCFGIGLAASGK